MRAALDMDVDITEESLEELARRMKIPWKGVSSLKYLYGLVDVEDPLRCKKGYGQKCSTYKKLAQMLGMVLETMKCDYFYILKRGVASHPPFVF